MVTASSTDANVLSMHAGVSHVHVKTHGDPTLLGASSDCPVALEPPHGKNPVRVSTITHRVTQLVTSITGRHVDAHTPLMVSGIDSLAAVELHNMLQAEFGIPISATAVMDHPNIKALAEYVHATLQPVKQNVTTPAAVTRSGLMIPAATPVGMYGMAARVPGASESAACGSGLQHGSDAVTMVPHHRWLPDDYASMFDHEPVRFGSFLPNVTCFDTSAFGLSESEVVMMDPQQRLLLEVCAEALLPDQQTKSVMAAQYGVYIGISAVDYNKLATRLSVTSTPSSATGSLSLSVAAGRVSYTFGLKGPAMAIDTACSSSLVAIHSGIAGLALGHAAACGGVNLMLIPDTPALFDKAGMQHSVCLTYCTSMTCLSYCII